MGKTKILSNTEATGHLKVRGHQLEILRNDVGTMYLGRLLSVERCMETELENRLQKAWKAFFSHKKQLCNRRFAIRKRLQLFNSTVTAVMLYGSGAWTLKSDDLKRLQSEQRKMLRMMLQTQRKFIERKCSTEDSSSSECDEPDSEADELDDDEPMLEDWVTWIRRATHFAEAELKKASVTDWVHEQRGRYWDLAGRVARCSDGRWSHEILNWIPEHGARNWGAPKKRWRDDIANFCRHSLNEHWEVLAQDVYTWNSLKKGFIEAAVI